MTDCPFCDIAADIAQWDDKVPCDWGPAFALAPLNPITLGHTLIVPRQHVAHAAEDPAVTAEVFRCAAVYAARHLNMHFNLITSAGSDATQTVPHLHVHYVPRRPGDRLHLPWTLRG